MGQKKLHFDSDGTEKSVIEPLTHEEIRAQSLRRAKRMVVDLINCNSGQSHKNTDKFLTLTQADFESNITVSNKYFHRFIIRLNRYLGTDVRYLNIVEFQKKYGTVHYHLALFSMPYVPQSVLAKLWGRGYVWVSKIQPGTNVGTYMSKYMVKDIDDPRLEGEKCYMASKFLSRPLISTIEEIVNLIYFRLAAILKPLRVCDEFPVRFLDWVTVERFDLWRYPKEVRYLRWYLAKNSLTV
jgi:hypothetical protein